MHLSNLRSPFSILSKNSKKSFHTLGLDRRSQTMRRRSAPETEQERLAAMRIQARIRGRQTRRRYRMSLAPHRGGAIHESKSLNRSRARRSSLPFPSVRQRQGHSQPLLRRGNARSNLSTSISEMDLPDCCPACRQDALGREEDVSAMSVIYSPSVLILLFFGLTAWIG
jgi:hypothetical protein